jgi:hypothetical protein
MQLNHPIYGSVKLGKKPPKRDSRTLMLARYIKALPPPPPAVDWTTKIPGQQYGMMMNDSLGDCTCAGMGHGEQIWSSETGVEVTVPDSVILSAYEAIGGYNPADPNSDQGCVELDVLNWWRQNGLGGHKIDAFVAVNVQNPAHLKTAINLFGFIYIGLALPKTIENQTDLWDVVAGQTGPGQPGEPGSEGGHCVIIPKYDPGIWTCITWGAPQKMTDAFVNLYLDEAYALVSKEWLSSVSGKTPSGLDYAALEADLQSVTG